MATDKQIAANRLNAQKSTGPKTPEGKKRSSQNRIIHGFRGTETVLADEDYDGYRHLVADLYEEWKPQTATECLQVEIMARSFWHIRRAARMETEHHNGQIKDGTGAWISEHVDLMGRYESRSQRNFRAAIETLRKLQADRRKYGLPEPEPHEDLPLDQQPPWKRRLNPFIAPVLCEKHAAELQNRKIGGPKPDPEPPQSPEDTPPREK